MDAGFLTPWAVYFRRQDKPLAQIVGDYERSFWQMRQESRARVQVNLEQREQLAQQEARVQELAQQLERAQGGQPADLARDSKKMRRCALNSPLSITVPAAVCCTVCSRCAHVSPRRERSATKQ